MVLQIGLDIAAVGGVREDLKRQYPDIFQGVGTFNTNQITLYVNPDVPPVAQPMSRLELNMPEKVQKK